MRHTILSVSILLALSASALADEAQEAEAKKHYEQGQTHYDLGEFDKAIENFKKAFEVSGFPQLLFNIAQSYRLKGDARQALLFYKSFLRKLPDAPNRAYVEDRIKEMEAAIAAERTAPSPTEIKPGEAKPIPTPSEVAKTAEPVGPTPAVNGAGAGDDLTASDPIYKKWWFWVGVGGAVVVTTVVIVAVASAGGGVMEPETDFPVVDVF